MKIYTSGRRIY